MSRSRLIKGLPVPPLLIELIRQGAWQELTTDGLTAIAPFLDAPMEWLQSLEEMERVSRDVTVLEEEVLGIRSSRSSGQDIALPLLDHDHGIFLAINRVPG
ncbi:MAG: hypothetical protein QGG40_06480, partial [Myxococcota bacterium]|nr:hypothetical protein [Myxococcota bacterium]